MIAQRSDGGDRRVRTWHAPVATLLACAALAVRSVSYRSLVATACVGALGVGFARDQVSGEGAPARARWLAVTGAGTAAFMISRAIASPIGIHFTALGIASIAVAAVLEELFFRRYCYGWVAQRYGAWAAIAVSAALFAVVHIPTYGARVFAIDFAAGVLLGSQRMAAGTWTAPAVTHVIANLLQMG